VALRKYDTKPLGFIKDGQFLEFTFFVNTGSVNGSAAYLFICLVTDKGKKP
jgi:hypothetical protein